jgi:protein-L-isoaspartate(D-aspartate) O-methyltransferase
VTLSKDRQVELRLPQGILLTMSDESSLARTRERLAARVITANRIGSTAVAAALRDVPRHLFLPGLPPESAYRDDAIVTKRDADGQPISSSSQPAIMAIMLDQLALAPGLRVLEIGAGTGYNAALMRHIVGADGTVVSVDIDAEVAAEARRHLASAGYPDVTVVAADGAAGYPPSAPYDRVIATVGVSDLAPVWLDQLHPDGRIVVPLDVRGTQLAVAFEHAAPEGPSEAAGGFWRSVSLTPCGFMRMRGPLAGPERTVLLAPGLSVTLPDGRTLADGKDIVAGAVAGYLGGPPTELTTGVTAGSVQVIWGLGLWLAAADPRSCTVSEERTAGGLTGRGRQASGPGASRLARAPVRTGGLRATAGIVDSGGLAVLTGTPLSSAGTGAAPRLLALAVAGFGPHGPALAAALAAHVRAWDQAGQPGPAGLHVDAYPRSSAAEPGARGPARSGLLIERPSTRFAVYHT